MQPIFGSFRQPVPAAVKGHVGLGILMTGITFMASTTALPPGLRIAAVPISILMAFMFGVGIWLDANTIRIVGPAGIGIRSPISRLSWQIPIVDVDRCQLVQASPHRKLRVIKKDGSAKSLPVTHELWDAVLSIKPSQ